MHIAIAVVGERVEIPVGVVEEASGNRHRDISGEAPVSQHAVQQRATGAPITVGERVDRLKLCVSNCAMHENGEVCAVRKLNEVGHQRGHSFVVWRNELRCVRRERATAHESAINKERTTKRRREC